MIVNKRFNFNFGISEPKQKNNIVLFYLSSKEKIKSNLISFPEAFSKDLVKVEEVNDKGIVRYLKVTNISDQKLLILESEQIIGNGIKQNRVVDSTTLIPEFSNITLKVSCCEKNRWSPSVANELNLSDSLYFSKGRINNSEDIYKKRNTDQFKIWEDISDKLKEFGSRSFTGSVEDIYNKRRNNVEEVVSSFNPGPNDIGVAIATANCLVSLDIFSSNFFLSDETISKLFCLSSISFFCDEDLAPSSLDFNSSTTFSASNDKALASSRSSVIVSFLSSITSEILGKAIFDKTKYKIVKHKNSQKS